MKPDEELSASWLADHAENPLRRLLRTLRQGAWLIALTFAIVVAAAALYLLVAPRVYRAEAELLITPVPRDDALLAGLGVIRESGDPTREIQTVARLVTLPDVAERAAASLRGGDPTSLARQVTAEPVAQSNVIVLVAEATGAGEARGLANAFAKAAVAERSEQFQGELRRAIRQLEPRLRDLPRGEGGADTLLGDLGRLETLRGEGDPTVRVAGLARLPASPASPQPAQTLIAAAVAGLLLGCVGALALSALDPRLRREDQLGDVLRLPVLARVPARGRSGPPIAPSDISAETAEGYRLLASALVSGERDERRSLLVTSPTRGDGKTTTALSLGASLAATGKHVLIIEADVRDPVFARLLVRKPKEEGLFEVVHWGAPLQASVATIDRAMPWLTVLPIVQPGASTEVPFPFSPAQAQALIGQAQELADYVIVDAASPAEHPNALALANAVDDVLVVVRLGNPAVDQVVEFGELLSRQSATPIGVALLGGRSAAKTYRRSAYRPSAAPPPKRDIEPPAVEPVAESPDPQPAEPERA